MPTIDVSDRDFARLQKIATPLVDTASTAFTKLLDFYEAAHDSSTSQKAKKTEAQVKTYEPDNLPPLVHTKLMDGHFDEKRPEKVNWDSMVRLALEAGIKTCKSTSELYRLSGANVVQGKKEDEGYKHVPSLDFSYQGVSAEDAAQIVLRCARALGCRTSFEFVWRDKKGAYRPGERGIVEV